MKYINLFIILFLCFTTAYSQYPYSVGFKEDSAIVKRSNQKQFFLLVIKAESLPLDSVKYKVQFEYDIEKSTLPFNAFTLNKSHLTKEDIDTKTSEAKLFIEFKADKEMDRVRFLVFKLSLVIDTINSQRNDSKWKNIARYQEITIQVKPYKAPNTGGKFDQLAYVGTNFDLAEGKLESNNLFFAANVMKRPHTPDNKVGFYLSLYGNRALTQVDSTGTRIVSQNQIIDASSYRTISIVNEIISERTSDNLGSYISPLIKIKAFNKTNNHNGEFALYYAPSLEFVWRRTQERVTFNEVSRDSLTFTGTPANQNVSQELRPINRRYNEFAFNAGFLGLFMVFENESLSVRVHGSVGYTSTYSGINNEGTRFEEYRDIFFSGRAWITESTTGITLQAEVNNAWSNPRPFFVATISKAISFKDLGTIFKPISGG
jgi:hypothetical protein